MIRILTIGKYATILFFILGSTVVAKSQKYNFRFVYDDQTFCIFDSLKLSIPFPSNVVNFKANLGSRELERVNGSIRPYLSKCIGSFSPPKFHQPKFECYLFLAKDGIEKKLLNRDAPNEFTISDNYSYYMDSVNFQIFKIIGLESDTLLFVGISDKVDFGVFRYMCDKIFAGIKSGINYKNISLTHPFDVYRKAILNSDSTLNYVQPYLTLKERVYNYEDKPSRVYYVQALHTALANFTNIDSNDSISQSRISGYFPRKILASSVLYNDSTALEYIVDQCKGRSLVMLNESHYLPNGRMLGSLLMKRLAVFGFKYLAFECIWDERSLREKRFTTASTGFYSNEPMMASLINGAINSKYLVFGYDSDSVDRDKYAARNVYERTFAQDSAAKVLVFAGYGHISKQAGKRTLANELKKLTGHEPLCINQTDFQYDSKHWLSVVDSSRVGCKHYITADIHVSNGLTYNKFAQLQQYTCYRIPKFKLDKGDPFIVSIYNADNFITDKKVIPVYNYFSESVRDVLPLEILLPSGRYWYAITQNNTTINSGKLQLK